MSRFIGLPCLPFGKNGNFNGANQRIRHVTNFELTPRIGNISMIPSVSSKYSSKYSSNETNVRFLTTKTQNDRLRRLRQQPAQEGDAIMQANFGEFPHESRFDTSELESMTSEILATKNFFQVQELSENERKVQYCEYNDEILQKAVKVIRHYSSEKNPSLDLSTMTQGSKSHFSLPGAHICHNILTSKIMPQPNMTVSDKQVDSIIEMFFLAIMSFGNLSKAKNRRYSKTFKTLFNDGNMSEGLLRLLVSTKVVNQRGNNDRIRISRRKRKLVFCYNSTLGNWAKIAASTSYLHGNQNALELSREAAMKAERLLLEMALVRSQSHDLTQYDDHDNFTLQTLLSYVQPDVVSFNSVISAWAASIPSTSNNSKHKDRHNVNTAPERADAILTLMKDLADSSTTNFHDEQIIRPDRRSYDAVINAWSRSSSPDALDQTLRLLNDMMKRYDAFDSQMHGADFKQRRNLYKINAPPIPTAKTLSSIFSCMTQSSFNMPRSIDAEDLLSKVKKWYHQKGLNWKSDTVLYNSLLSVIAKDNFRNNQNNIDSMYQTCSRIDDIIENDMTISSEKSSSVLCQPDSVTYGISISSWTSCAEALSSKMKGKNKTGITNVALECADNAMASLEKFISTLSNYASEKNSKKEKRQPNMNKFNDVMKAYGIAQEPEKAEEILRLAQSIFPQTKLNSTSYEVLIDAYINVAYTAGSSSKLTKEEAIDKAAALLSEMEIMISDNKIHFHRSETPVYNNVIEAYSRLGKLECVQKADDILNRMINLYNSNHGIKNSKNDFYKKASRAYPNTFTFNTVLAAYNRLCYVPSPQLQNHLERTQGLIQTMEEIYSDTRTNDKAIYHTRNAKTTPQIVPNVITYNILLNILSKKARFAKNPEESKKYIHRCEDLIQKMQDDYVRGTNKFARPDKFTYGALMNAVVDSRIPGAAERSKRLLEHLTNLTMQNFVHPNIKDNSIKPFVDRATLNIVLKAIKNDSNNNKSKDALDFLQRMKKGYFVDTNSDKKYYGPLIYPDKFTYCTVISTVAKEGTMEAAKICLNLLKDLEEDNKKNYQSDNKIQKKSVGDTISYNATMTAFTNVGTSDAMERAVKLLKHMEDMQITDEISYKIIMNGWAKIGNDSRANELQNHMRKRKFSINK